MWVFVLDRVGHPVLTVTAAGLVEARWKPTAGGNGATNHLCNHAPSLFRGDMQFVVEVGWSRRYGTRKLSAGGSHSGCRLMCGHRQKHCTAPPQEQVLTAEALHAALRT